MFEAVSPPVVWFPNKILYVLRISNMRATGPANIILVPRLVTGEIAFPLIFQLLSLGRSSSSSNASPGSRESSILSN